MKKPLLKPLKHLFLKSRYTSFFIDNKNIRLDNIVMLDDAWWLFFFFKVCQYSTWIPFVSKSCTCLCSFSESLLLNEKTDVAFTIFWWRNMFSIFSLFHFTWGAFVEIPGFHCDEPQTTDSLLFFLTKYLSIMLKEDQVCSFVICRTSNLLKREG